MNPIETSAAEPHVGFWHTVTNGLIDCENTVQLAAPPAAVVEALRGDWAQWWKGGATADRRPNAKGGETFRLNPVVLPGGLKPEVLTVETEAPREEALPDGGTKVVLPATLVGGVNGACRFEVFPGPDGGTIIRSVWDHVKPSGAMALGPMPHLAADLHLLVEGRSFKHLDEYLAAR